jgi:hypothetical protein
MGQRKMESHLDVISNVMYRSWSTTPGENHDSNDTAGVGQPFFQGDYWFITSRALLYICQNDNPGFAKWRLVPIEDTRTHLFIFHEEFMNTNGLPFSVSTRGSGSGLWSASQQLGQNGIGWADIRTNALDGGSPTSVGACSLSSSLGMYLGGGTWYYKTRVCIDTLSTASDEFKLYIGLHNAYAQLGNPGVIPTITNGIFFEYDRTVSPNWQACSVKAGVLERVNTGVAVAINTEFVLKMDVSADGNTVVYSINGTVVVTKTTNLPNTSANRIDLNVMVVRTTSTGVIRRLYCDYIFARMTPDTLRS